MKQEPITRDHLQEAFKLAEKFAAWVQNIGPKYKKHHSLWDLHNKALDRYYRKRDKFLEGGGQRYW